MFDNAQQHSITRLNVVQLANTHWLHRKFSFYCSFFEKNPEYQKLFPEFKELTYEELQNAKTIYGHGKRVMKAIENAISALDDSVSFSAYLEELGRRHKARSLKPYLLDVST